MEPFTVGALLIGSAGALSGLYYYLYGSQPNAEQLAAEKARLERLVFKAPLDQVPKDPATGLPPIVLKVITYLKSGDGIKYQGLFRQSGCQRTLKEMVAKIDNGETVSFDGVDTCTVGDILKYYLRVLPEPLFPFAYYTQIIQIEGNYQRDHDIAAWLQSVTHLIAELSPAHRALTQELFSFLATVAANEKQNWMTVGNLATIFAPSIIYSPPVPSDSAASSEAQGIAPEMTKVLVGTWTSIQFVVKCIEHADTIARVQPLTNTSEQHQAQAAQAAEAQAAEEDEEDEEVGGPVVLVGDSTSAGASAGAGAGASAGAGADASADASAGEEGEGGEGVEDEGMVVVA
eukprot:TRINITY_DN1051_c0_g1_i1.p1 TRINITY_DN1051_c0_g1~~TRINITY_DN1051_c0_g1_i1.p1  ORF type:complete len:346 (-),score=64.17 TRINITY_DN1051_c0_g1_i1:60-1097(-)